MKKTIKFMSAALALAMCVSAMPMSAFAFDNWENAVPGGENEVDVTLTIDESWRVKIPKTIELDAESKSAEYSVEVNGNIAGTDGIKIVPDADFQMAQNGKNAITATITQDKKIIGSSEIEDGTVVTLDGSISAPSATSGTWNGSFNFNIELVKDIISFKIIDTTASFAEDASCYAEKDMTWSEWISSDYYTPAHDIHLGGYTREDINCTHMACPLYADENTVKASDAIISGQTYKYTFTD